MIDIKKIYEPYLEKTLWNKTEIMIFCPFHSHNHNTPSLSVNTKTGQFHCKACSESGGSITFYAKTRNVSISQALKDLDEFDDDFKERPVQIMPQLPSKPRQLEEHDYSDYISQILDESLLHDDRYAFYGQKLYELRGITYPTAVACLIGYDPKKGWVFPTIRYGDNRIIGYEVRKKDFKLFDNGTKCYRSKGGANCLSVTYSGDNKDRAYICEGAIDSCFLWQFLHEKKQQETKNEYARVTEYIMTPSNGVKSLPDIIAELEIWNDFKEVIFILDEDNAGREAKEKIAALEHQGKFKFFSGLLEGEDFEDWLKRKQKEGKNGN